MPLNGHFGGHLHFALGLTYNIFRTIRIKGKLQFPKGCNVLSATTKLNPETEAAAYEIYHRKYEMKMYLAGVSVPRVEDITEALWGSMVSPSTISNMNRKIYGHIENWK